MNEKKLTDEVVVKALEHCSHNRSCEYCYHNDERGSGEIVCRSRLMGKSLDLIHRLQKENEELKSPKFASWKLKFFRLKEEFDKELAEHEEFAKKANAEIERMTEELKKCGQELIESHREQEELQDRNAELQKQVDELTASREIQINELHEQHAIVAEEIKQQSVKASAKEIYGEINDSDILVVQTQEYGEIEVVPIERLKEIIKQKGVEVE